MLEKKIHNFSLFSRQWLIRTGNMISYRSCEAAALIRQQTTLGKRKS